MIYEEFFEKNRDKILRDLDGLIAIPSESHDLPKVREALHYVLDLAKDMGMRSQSLLDDQIGIVETGQGDETCAILVHVDVVSTEGQDEWETDPFKMTEKDGRLYGRGTLDDKGMVIAMNPSPMDDYLLGCDLGKVSYFIMNEIEAAAISGCMDPEDAIKELHSRYPDSRLVITLGSDGVKYFDGEKTYSHGIYKVETVDTTAAGDTFTGYFLNGVLTGMKADDILDMASKASRIAVSRNGAADSIPTKDEVLSSKLELK